MANEFIARNGLIAQNNSTVTGSLEVTQGITGSLLGTASYATQALTASYASTYAPVFPFTGSAIITGSLEVTGSIRALVTGSDLVNIGNRTTASQRLVRIGQDASWLDIGSVNGIPSFAGIYANVTPGGSNYILAGDGSGNGYLNGGSACYMAVGGNAKITHSTVSTTFTQGVNGGGGVTAYFFNVPSNLTQTTTANIPNFRITGANKQWATGTVANQYWNYLTSNTASFVGASTMTNSYGLFVEAATAGTNATITNNWAIGANGGGILVRGFSGTVLDVGNTFSIFNVVASSGVCSAYNLYVTNGAMTIQTVTPTLVFNNSAVQVRRNSNSLFLDTYDDLTVRNTLSLYNMLVLRGTKTTGALISFDFTAPTNTNQTLSTNIPNFKITGANKQWATGTLANQYFNYFTANTASFVGASTATNVYGLFAEAAIAGTNATITNNWGIGTTGDIQVGGTGTQIVFSTATNAYVRNTSGNLRLSCGAGARVAIDADGSLVGSFTSALSSITTTTLNLSGITTIAGDTTINSAVGSSLTLTSGARNTGVRTLFTLTGSSDTNQTTSTEVNRVLWTMGSKTWATGNITNQREFLITSPTYNFNGASTITNAYNAYFEAPTAGTNATITNNYAAGFSGSVYISRGLVLGTTSSAFIGSGQVYASNGFLSVANSSLGGIIGYTNNLGLYSKFGNGAVSIGHNGGTTTVMNIYSSSMNYTGSAFFTGSLTVTGSVNASSFTGSLFGTASYATQALSSSFATTASYALNVPATASYALQALSSSYALTASYLDNYTPPFPFTGSAIITGSLEVTGSITSTEGFTGSFQGDGSGLTGITAAPAGPDKSIQFNDAGATSGSGDFTFDKSLNIAYLTGSLEVTNGITGSLYGTATSASYINGSIIKSNSVPPGMFGGTPLTTSITFTADFPNPNYSVTITGEDARIFTIQNKSATGFEINTNSNIALTGNTYWHAISYGEFNS
jgi:hypothetical protein